MAQAQQWLDDDALSGVERDPLQLLCRICVGAVVSGFS